MELGAARIDQVLESREGDWVIIDKDVGGAVEELKRIDPKLNVRLNPKQGFFAVFTRDENGDQLVRTFPAHQNRMGVWEGLDQRIVDRFKLIDPHGRGGYDYVAELEKQDEQARQARAAARRELAGEIGERAAHAIRKDLGSTSRIVVPK